MNTVEIQTNCPECKSSLIDDAHNGEVICSTCGIVVAEQMADYGPETKSSNLEDKMKLARATGQTTYSQHDLGIATEISISTKDYSGKTINSQVANQMHNLRKWQQRIRVSSPRERRLANVLSKIGETCHSISLPQNVLETSSMIYRSLDDSKAFPSSSPNTKPTPSESRIYLNQTKSRSSRLTTKGCDRNSV